MSRKKMMLLANKAAFFTLLLLAVFCLATPANAAVHKHGENNSQLGSWSKYPMLMPVGGGRGNKTVSLINSQADTVTVFSAVSTKKEASPPYWNSTKTAKGFVITPKNSIGGYHWVMARHESAELVEVATSIVYFSMPAPPPTEMLNRVKNRLEIIPQPMPREHAHYRAGESWPFLIRFHGKPLAAQTVNFISEQGESLSFTSNTNGIAEITFPKEFKTQTEAKVEGKKMRHGHTRPKANFILTTTYLVDGKRYQTTFNNDYRPGPFFNKSLATGFGFMFLGVILATPLLRKPKKNRGQA
ncbi:MAG: hypothetical protein HQL68_11965 [Magnetococcales bacterium]|nr:hypothetical protein [Magnetococcales bacterium]